MDLFPTVFSHCMRRVFCDTVAHMSNARLVEPLDVAAHGPARHVYVASTTTNGLASSLCFHTAREGYF